jgi:IS5 family transposase
MRSSIRQQLPIVQPQIDHEHARELQAISEVLDKMPQAIELVHADLVRGLSDPDMGREGMTAEQVLRATVIKQLNSFSYEELAFHLADSCSYNAFCRLGLADDAPSKSALQRDIKKLTPQTLEMINRGTVELARDEGIEKGRKVRTDCTVTEANIHHPTDSSLLEDGVRVLTRLMARAKDNLGDIGIVFCNHHRRARKRALGILNAKKKKQVKLYRDLIKVAHKTVNYAEQVAEHLDAKQSGFGSVEQVLLASGIADELWHFIPLVAQVIDQAERRVLYGEKLRPADKVVSIFEPHADIIVKDRRETYFGHKLAIAGGASGLLTDLVITRGNPRDSTLAKEMIQRQQDIYGRPPRQAAFDGGFASKDNLRDIKKMGVKDVAFHRRCGLEISQMAKSTWVYKRLRNFRAGIEGMISFLKRGFGLGRCNWRGFESFKAYAWSSVLTANLLLVARHMIT